MAIDVVLKFAGMIQVWVVPDLKDGKISWKADSDSLLTKVRTISNPNSRAKCRLMLYSMAAPQNEKFL